MRLHPTASAIVMLLAAACSKRTPPPAPAPAADTATTSTADLPAPVDAGPALHPGPWNVVLISIDSLRADMPWAGYPRPIAPRLSALHAKSIAYARAYSTSSFTSKSIPGMLTGRYPSELDRTNVFFTRYLDKKAFFCTGLDAQDIPCVGAHAHAYFGKGQSGFETGFRKWELVPGITFDYQTDPYVTSQKLTPIAIDMLREAGATNKPFFAWFHYMDPHDQYQKHEESPHFGTRPRDLYDEEVFFTDLWVGKLLDFIEQQPWAAHTVIGVTADHGEAFGEHGITRHAHEVWEELVHVPMFFYVPGATPRVIDTPRGHADLAPTILELVGAKKDDALRGTSLVGEFRGGEAAQRDVIVDLPEDDYNERRRALIHGKWKLIAFGNDVRFSLFDLEEDPKEATDLYWKRREMGEEMRQRYKDASKQIKDVPPRGGVQKKGQ
jgi:arylsulfatase A-like enzyme